MIDSFFDSCIKEIAWRTGVEIGIENIPFSIFTGKSLFTEKINIILFGAFIIKVECSIFRLLLY